MPNIGAPELIIVGIILVLLFGATRLPATAKGLGQALRLFKKEIREDEDKKPEVTAGPQQPVQQPVQPASVGQPVQTVQQQPVQQQPVQQQPVQQQPVQQQPVQQNGTSDPAPDQSAIKPGNQV